MCPINRFVCLKRFEATKDAMKEANGTVAMFSIDDPLLMCSLNSGITVELLGGDGM